ncbi:MAG TPA: hypothetical protein VGA94_06005 [Thermodesulfobacteriota bacterium]
MIYREVVENEIEGEDEELKRRKKLWGKISEANERGGVDTIKDILTGEGEIITDEFEKLLEKLKEKL